MKTIVFFLEEPSAKEMLMGILPQVLPNGIQARYMVFSGKQALEKRLVKRLRGWQAPNSMFVVIRDQDSADCQIVKQTLLALCKEAGREDTLVRIFCHELETLYLGDLAAVEKGLGLHGLARKQLSQGYREPDSLPNPSQVLKKLTRLRYQKVGGSRAIAPHLDLMNNRSRSFHVLLSAIQQLVQAS